MKKSIVGILAHVDAGKTTLSEAILYLGGAIRQQGRVDHQTAFLDHFALERQRGITIFSKQAKVTYGELKMTLLDTPGHVDFATEAERTLQVLDYAVLVISAIDGVQSHTETLWKLLKDRNLPVFLFINKMDIFSEEDRENKLAELEKELKSRLSERIVVAGKEEFLENAAMCDERAMNEYIETETLKEDTIAALTAKRRLFPCFFGSALKLEGVEDLLEGMGRYCLDKAYPNEFGAKVFKITRDEGGRRLTHLKVTGGSLRTKDMLGEEKADQLRVYSGNKYEVVQEISAGEICAVTGFENTYSGQGFGIEEEAPAGSLLPVMTYQVLLPDHADPIVMLTNLKKLEEEEPSLHVIWDEGLKEIHVRIMGSVQMEILKETILEQFGVAVEFDTGHIMYRETIAGPVEGMGHFEPLRHYAEVRLLLEPLPLGSGLVFESALREDELDLNWQRLILTHLGEREHPGVLTGSPITDMKITLIGGKAHLKHTEGGDFREAVYRAVRQGLKSGESLLLEPMYAFTLEVPAGQIGRAMSDIKRMQGSFDVPLTEKDMAVLSGKVPVATSVNYQSSVAAYTKGKGRLSLQSAGYDLCHNPDEVIEEIGYDSEKDIENPTGSVFCDHGAGIYKKWDEVPCYMHTQSKTHPFILNEAEEGESESIHWGNGEGRDHSRGSGLAYDGALDKELEAIMLREFGEIKRPSYKEAQVSYHAEGKTVDAEGYEKNRKQKKIQKEEPYLLVDGYNIIHAWKELKELAENNLDAARGRLADILCNYQGFTKEHVILVFDAYKVKGSKGEVEAFHNIHIVYTKEKETADMYIEKVTKEIGKRYRVRVATSDGMEQLIAMGHGAVRISAAEFEKEMERTNEKIRDKIKTNRMES